MDSKEVSIVMWYRSNEMSLSHKNEWNPVISGQIDENEGHYVKQNKPGTKRQILHFLTWVEASS